MDIRPIDANALKNLFEEDGHLSGYIEEYVDNCPTLDYVPCQQWISADDEHPKSEKIVLLGYSDKQFIDIGYLDYEDMRWYRLDDNRIARPTHWMLLPEPPKEE